MMQLFSERTTVTPYEVGFEHDFEAEEDEGSEGEEFQYGFIPTLDSGPDLERNERFVDYNTRGPRDVVLSGPVLGGWGPGRYHRSRRVAYAYLEGKFGEGRVVRTPQSKGRWSFLVKNLKVVG
jgi:hypothetical protein